MLSKLLNIAYEDHLTNEEVHNKIQDANDRYDDVISILKKRKLRWYGHISRASGMTKTILQGTIKETRRRGRQRKRWKDSIKNLAGLE